MLTQNKTYFSSFSLVNLKSSIVPVTTPEVKMKVYGFTQSDIAERSLTIGQQASGGGVRRSVQCPKNFLYLHSIPGNNQDYKLVRSDSSQGWIIRLKVQLQGGSRANCCISTPVKWSEEFITLARGIGGENHRKGKGRIMLYPWCDYLFATKLDDFWLRVYNIDSTQILSFSSTGVKTYTYQEARGLGFDLKNSTGCENGDLVYLN